MMEVFTATSGNVAFVDGDDVIMVGWEEEPSKEDESELYIRFGFEDASGHMSD